MRGVLTSLLACVLSVVSLSAVQAAPAARPRLVVVVVVDQLRLEDLELFGPLLGPGNLGGLLKKGELLEGRYLTANTETGAQQVVDAPELQYPTGVAAAKNAPVMAVATENAIYSATFE